MDGRNRIDAGLAEPAEIAADMPDAEGYAQHAEDDGHPQNDIADHDARDAGKYDEQYRERDEDIERHFADEQQFLAQIVLVHVYSPPSSESAARFASSSAISASSSPRASSSRSERS